MSFRSAIFSTTSLVLLATSASADVTAKEIWSDWQAYLTGFGYAVEGTETMSGNTLEVNDLKMSVPMPEGSGDFAVNLSKISFVENNDGTVNLVFPEVMPVVFEVMGPEGEAVKGSLDYIMRNQSMRASGDPSKVVYDYTADQIGIALKDLVVDGEALPEGSLVANFTSNNMSGQSLMEPGALRKIAQNMTTGESTYNIMFKSPDSEDGLNVTGSMASLTFAGDSFIPEKIDPENMASALNDGFAIDGDFSYTGSKAEFSFSDGSDTMSGSSGAESASVSVKMNKDLLAYSGSSKGVNFNVNGAQIPLPIVAGLGEMAFNILIPVAKSDTPSDFSFGLTLADFVTSDDLWSMLDAGNVLPRDPATISLDIVGKAKMLFDFFDPEQMSAVEDGEAMPAELEALTLRNLLVSAAGAELSGTGDFTFDNNDLESYGGFPKPTGGVDVKLVGGNGLMDKLVEMGLLPPEQAMGARMMMGLFARPGEGDDTLTTKVEINEQGHILANGQRIQ